MARVNKTIVFVLWLAFAPLAHARTKAPQEPKKSKAVQTILQLEEQWDRAVVGHDRTELDRLMERDFVATDVYGNMHSRADYLNALTSPDVQYDYRHSDEIQVKAWGDTAVAVGIASVKARFRAHDINTENRYMRVYVKRHGRWYTVAEQSTEIAKEP